MVRGGRKKICNGRNNRKVVFIYTFCLKKAVCLQTMMMALTDVVWCPLHVAVRLRHVNAEVHEAVRVAPFDVVPHTSFTKFLFSAMPALMSKIDENLLLMKSVLTTSSSVQLKTPFIDVSDASLIAATISS